MPTLASDHQAVTFGCLNPSLALVHPNFVFFYTLRSSRHLCWIPILASWLISTWPPSQSSFSFCLFHCLRLHSKLTTSTMILWMCLYGFLHYDPAGKCMAWPNISGATADMIDCTMIEKNWEGRNHRHRFTQQHTRVLPFNPFGQHASLDIKFYPFFGLQ